MRLVAALLLAWAAEAGAAPADRGRGPVTQLPLPRFVSLRSEPVNLRVGPGRRYPVAWVLQRRGLPVRVVKEFKEWRGIRLADGTSGWVHAGVVSGSRTFLVNAGTARPVRAQASGQGRLVAVLKPGVVGRLLSCAAGHAWCRVEVGRHRGFLPREAFWGIDADEDVAG